MDINKGKKIYFPSFFLCLIYIAVFLNFPYFKYYTLIKYFILLICGIYILFNFKVLTYKKFLRFNFILILYLSLVLFSGFINRNIGTLRNSFLVSIIFCGTIFEGTIIFERFYYDKKNFELISVLYYLTLFFIILTDILILFNVSVDEDNSYYLIGNKFSVSYLHIFLICLSIMKNNNHSFKSKLLNVLYPFITFFITIYIQCSTGIIGTFLFLILIILSKKTNLLKSKIFFLTCFFVSFTFFISFDYILSNSFIKYVIQDIFGEDLTLTGRIDIYENMFDILKGHYLFGYGYGNSFEVMMNFMRAPNTQNGLLECILTQGIIASLLLIILICYSMFCRKKRSELIPLIYMYILLSSIEITFGLTFIIYIILLFLETTYEEGESYESINFINAKNY